MTMLSIKQIKY